MEAAGSEKTGAGTRRRDADERRPTPSPFRHNCFNSKRGKMVTEINNGKNVYILGAGCSKKLGIPLQDEFILLAKEVFFRDPA